MELSGLADVLTAAVNAAARQTGPALRLVATQLLGELQVLRERVLNVTHLVKGGYRLGAYYGSSYRGTIQIPYSYCTVDYRPLKKLCLLAIRNDNFFCSTPKR